MVVTVCFRDIKVARGRSVRDLTGRGAFVDIDTPLPVGTKLGLQPEAGPVLAARVAHVVEVGTPRGMQVFWEELSEEARRFLQTSFGVHVEVPAAASDTPPYAPPPGGNGAELPSPTQSGAPQSAAPQNAASQDAAPQDAAPQSAAPEPMPDTDATLKQTMRIPPESHTQEEGVPLAQPTVPLAEDEAQTQPGEGQTPRKGKRRRRS